MPPHAFDRNEWALILGGSSGFGLATAHKLSGEGLNICVVHRDRRGAMSRIEPEFEAIRARGVSLVTYNQDALNSEKRGELLDALMTELGADGRIRVLLHSIAFGNLKLIAPEEPPDSETRDRLAERLGIDATVLGDAADEVFGDEVDGVMGIATPPAYSSDRLLEEEDMARTVHAMGTSLLSWTQDLHARGLFAADARTFGLTSEGNTVAWKGYAAVAAAKVALESVSRAIAVEMAHFGIRSNIIQAGVTDTPALKLIPGSGHLKAQARARNPFGRLTTPRDVANVIYLLSLPEAAWVNGEIIRVDGGEHVSGLTR
ncbi:MAG: SDR family oxidoreductase [Gemmatimonadota bacterium]|nr:SDR family oxidoreductase [Gemmatimonadota bacterium]